MSRRLLPGLSLLFFTHVAIADDTALKRVPELSDDVKQVLGGVELVRDLGMVSNATGVRPLDVLKSIDESGANNSGDIVVPGDSGESFRSLVRTKSGGRAVVSSFDSDSSGSEGTTTLKTSSTGSTAAARATGVGGGFATTFGGAVRPQEGLVGAGGVGAAGTFDVAGYYAGRLDSFRSEIGSLNFSQYSFDAQGTSPFADSSARKTIEGGLSAPSIFDRSPSGSAAPSPVALAQAPSAGAQQASASSQARQVQSPIVDPGRSDLFARNFFDQTPTAQPSSTTKKPEPTIVAAKDKKKPEQENTVAPQASTATKPPSTGKNTIQDAARADPLNKMNSTFKPTRCLSPLNCQGLASDFSMVVKDCKPDFEKFPIGKVYNCGANPGQKDEIAHCIQEINARCKNDIEIDPPKNTDSVTLTFITNLFKDVLEWKGDPAHLPAPTGPASTATEPPKKAEVVSPHRATD